jgi:hypothetical protein
MHADTCRWGKLKPVISNLLLLSAFICVHPRLSAAAEAPRPNFLVILCDDLGYGDLSCYGHPHIKSPNLDRLAQQGIRFTDCYSSAPVCSSSRAGLLTGRCPTRSGIYDWISEDNAVNLRTSEVTIPELLKLSGYKTCLAGPAATGRSRLRPLVQHAEQRRAKPREPRELCPRRLAGRPARRLLVSVGRRRGDALAR